MSYLFALGDHPVALFLAVLAAVAVCSRTEGGGGRLPRICALVALWAVAQTVFGFPWGALPLVAVGARKGLVRLAKAPWTNRAQSDRDGVLLGRSLANGRPVRLPLRHTVIVGASGSGKTVTVATLVRRAAVDHGLVVVDGKGDPALEEAVRQAALASGRPLWLWSPSGDLPYNPFAHGSEGELVDKALAGESYGDSYYLRLGQRFLGFAVRGLQAAGEEVTVGKLARFADPRQLAALAGAIEARRPGGWIEFHATLPKLSPRELEAVAGTRHRLAALAESEVGRLFNGGPGLDLLEAVGRGEAVYFNLNADARPELSQIVGAAILIDLMTVAADRQREGRVSPTLVVVDDLQGFISPPAARALASLFARGRSAGFAVVVGTQSLADLEQGARERLDQLLDNRYALLVHRLPGSRSAALASRELGEQRRSAVTEQVQAKGGRWQATERGSRSFRQEPVVSAQEIASLPVGCLYLSLPGKPPQAVQVVPGAERRSWRGRTPQLRPSLRPYRRGCSS